MSATLQVATTIAQQIGSRAFLMMGTKYKLGDADSVTFDIHGCPDYSKVKVTLEPNDTYTVTFYKFRNHQIARQKEVDGVYWDSLHHCIEANTGLCLSL